MLTSVCPVKLAPMFVMGVEDYQAERRHFYSDAGIFMHHNQPAGGRTLPCRIYQITEKMQ